jgi:Ca2+-binding RTX toxin-like protein
MATFTGTNANETIAPTLVSPTVTRDPPGAVPGAGNDSLYGLGGNDKLNGGGGDNLLDGGDGNDQLTGGRGNETLLGGAGTDTLKAGAGNDMLDGGAGADKMSGGKDDDIYIVDNIADVVTELASEGIDTVRASLSFTLSANVENLTLLGAGAFDGTGNEASNQITGNDGSNVLSGLGGNDTLDGGAGSDNLIGGLGDDHYIVDSAGDVIVEDAAAGFDFVTATVSYTLAANVEDLTLADLFNLDIDGTGNDIDNTIRGNGSDNVLSGMGGNDTIWGSGGRDTLLGGAGNDTLIHYTEPGFVHLDGGTGDDTYYISSKLDTVEEDAVTGGGIDKVITVVSFTLTANLENLEMWEWLGATHGTGNAKANWISGNSANNVLSGLDGDDTLLGNYGSDTLIGGAGADRLEGGEGNDLYLLGAGDTVIEDHWNSGIDTVETSLTYTLPANVEKLTLTGGDNVDGTGNGSDNVIKGNGGNNVLRGLGGDDTLNGGAGDDTLDGGGGADDMGGGKGADLYIVDSVNDIAQESNGDGAIDSVQASASHILTANIENLTLTGAGAINGTGNARANVIQGNGANNVLNGKGGADSVTGGGGADTFRFDTALVAGVVTTVADMTAGVDKIALGQAVFTQAGPVGALAADAFHIGAAAHDASDRIVYDSATGALLYDADGTGAQAAVTFAVVAPGLALTASDFKVV